MRSCFSDGDQPPKFEEHYESSDRVLGTGVGGAVKEVRCKRSGRVEAVKSFRKRTMTELEMKSMRSGISVHAELSHPCIVRVRGVYEAQDEVHVVMEKLGGGELFDKVLERGGAVSIKEAADAMAQLLRAVAYLHSRRVVHRDIKLENIVCEEGEGSGIKLIDFGHAVSLDDDEDLRRRCGTIGYIAPEVLRGTAYSAAADMWSIGVCAYSLLTGRAAYAGQTDSAVLHQNRRGLVHYGSSFQRLPLKVRHLVRRLLSLDPAERPTAREALQHPWLVEAAPAQVRLARRELGHQLGGDLDEPTTPAPVQSSPCGSISASSRASSSGLRRKVAKRRSASKRAPEMTCGLLLQYLVAALCQRPKLVVAERRPSQEKALALEVWFT